MKEILITSSVLILALLILRLIFAQKVRRTIIYAAWALVALRLLIPIQIGQLSFSVLTATKPLTETVTGIEELRVIGQNEREVEIQVTKDYIEQDLTVFTPEVQEFIRQEQAANTPAEEIASALVKTQGSEAYVPEARQQVQRQVAEQTNFVSIGQAAIVIWLVGVAGMAAWFLLVNLRHSKKLRKHREELECDSPIPVFVSDHVGSPCLVGLFRPVIYLTPESAADGEIRRHVLTHELTHYAHKDHIWSVVRCVCLCVYWFDPLVWAAAWYSRRDCELACDEGALKRLGQAERIAYGKTLLAVVSQATAPAHLMQTATSMNETKEQLKQRVNFIVKKPKWSIIAAVCMVLLCAIVAGCAAAGPASNGAAEERIRYTVTVHTKHESSTIQSDSTLSLVYNGKGQLLECEYDGIRYVYTYDKEGKKLSDKFFHSHNGELWKEYRYSYNDAGQLTLRELFLFTSDPNGKLGERTVYQYNSEGNLEYWAFSLNGVDVNMELFYDKQGNLVEERSYTGKTASSKRRTYTDDGKLLSVTTEQYGEPHTETRYVYNTTGVLIRKEYIHTCGNLPAETKVTTYSYDPLGRCVTYEVADAVGMLSVAEYTYDADGKVLSYMITDSSDTVKGYTWTYDTQGRMLSCNHIKGNDSNLCTWTYDTQGNVTGHTNGDVCYTLTYNYPGREIPVQIREEIARRLRGLTELENWSAEALASLK